MKCMKQKYCSTKSAFFLPLLPLLQPSTFLTITVFVFPKNEKKMECSYFVLMFSESEVPLQQLFVLSLHYVSN